jgi:hypothetical protein
LGYLGEHGESFLQVALLCLLLFVLLLGFALLLGLLRLSLARLGLISVWKQHPYLDNEEGVYLIRPGRWG